MNQTVPPQEIIVVDDGSEDDTEDMIFSCFPDICMVWWSCYTLEGRLVKLLTFPNSLVLTLKMVASQNPVTVQ